MNNLSAINNTPTLVQEIARQVSTIATMIGRVAHAAISYLVATLRAVPPLLPLMIVVVAGVTIAAIIIRNVLYPEASSSSQAPPPNQQQPINDGSSVQRPSSNRNRRPVVETKSEGEIPSNITRKRAANPNRVGIIGPNPTPFDSMAGRIRTTIQSSSGSDSGSNEESRTKKKSSNESKAANASDFSIDTVHEQKNSEDELEEIINPLPINVDVVHLIAEDKSRVTSSPSQMPRVETNPNIAITIKSDDENEDSKSEKEKDSVPIEHHSPILFDVIVEKDLDNSQHKKDETDPTESLAIMPTEEKVDEDDNGLINCSRESSYSTKTDPTSDPKRKSRVQRLVKAFSFGVKEKKESTLTTASLNNHRSSSTKIPNSQTQSEKGDGKASSFSFKSVASTVRWVRKEETPVATTEVSQDKPIVEPQKNDKPPFSAKTAWKNAIHKVAKRKAGEKYNIDLIGPVPESKIEKSLSQENDPITEEWIFGKKDSNLTPVEELNETASVSSTDNRKDVKVSA